MEVVKDPTTQPTVRALAADLARVMRSHTWHAARAAATTHRRVTLAGAAGAAVALANHAAPGPMLVADAVAAAAWVHLWAWPRWTTGYTRRERKVTDWLDAVWDAAGIRPAPTVRRDGRRLAVRVARHSWTIELDINTAEQGVRSAREFCGLWPRLKTEIGEGCVGVYLHEGRGRRVTMVVVWERDHGDRIVAITPSRDVWVLAKPRGGYRTWNPLLGGYVLPEHAHAAEHYRSDREIAENTITLDAEPEDTVDLEDAEELHDAEHDAETSDDDARDDDAPYDDDEPLPTWRGEEAAQPDPGGCNEEAGGGEQTTPPDPFDSPPSGLPASGMFPPASVVWRLPDRPLNARPGTGAGRAWDALGDGSVWARTDLAAVAGITPASVGNLLTDWARLGIVDHDGDGWRAVVSQHRNAVG